MSINAVKYRCIPIFTDMPKPNFTYAAGRASKTPVASIVNRLMSMCQAEEKKGAIRRANVYTPLWAGEYRIHNG